MTARPRWRRAAAGFALLLLAAPALGGSVGIPTPPEATSGANLKTWLVGLAESSSPREPLPQVESPRPWGMVALENTSHLKWFHGGDLLAFIPDVSTGIVVDVLGATGALLAQRVEAMAFTGTSVDSMRAAFIGDGHLIYLGGGGFHDCGPVGFGRVRGLAYQPGTNELYGVTYDTNRILHFDAVTGQATVAANHLLEGHRMTDLAFHPDGSLFIVTADDPPQLFELSHGIRSWTLQGGSALESLLWSPDGKTLYSASQRGWYKDLCTIDLKRSRIRYVSKSHSRLDNIEGLAWYPYGTITKASPPGGQLATAPAHARLEQNTPNPFNPATRIDFDLSQDADAELYVVDVTGQRVVTLFRGRAEAGRHQVNWNGRSERGLQAASGVYYYFLKTGTTTEARRMLLLK